MKAINACHCNSQFLDFIHTVVGKSGFEVQQVQINYCGPKSIYLSLFFYDEETLNDEGEYGEWREHEFRILYRKNPRNYTVRYRVFWGLESDGPFAYSGIYECPEGFPENGDE